MLGCGAALVPDVIPTHPRPTPTPGPGSGPCFSFGLSDLIAVSQFSSVQLSHSVVSDILLPHGLQHARLPSPSPTSTA